MEWERQGYDYRGVSWRTSVLGGSHRDREPLDNVLGLILILGMISPSPATHITGVRFQYGAIHK